MVDPRQRRTDDALRAAFLSLLERKALDQITILEICAAAGVHKATFFRRYGTKEALLDYVAADQINRLVELTLPAGHGIDGFRALCEYVDEHRVLWATLLTGGAGGTMREELLRVSTAIAIDRAPNHSWLPVQLAAICSATLIVETVAWWLKQSPGEYSIDHMAAMLHRLVGGTVG